MLRHLVKQIANNYKEKLDDCDLSADDLKLRTKLKELRFALHLCVQPAACLEILLADTACMSPSWTGAGRLLRDHPANFPQRRPTDSKCI